MLIPLKLTRRDVATYDISAARTSVGLLTAGIIRFQGFADRADADAAVAAMMPVLERLYHAGRFVPRGQDATTATAEDQILVNGSLVGAVIRTGASGYETADAYALDFHVPPAMWLSTMLQLAQQIYEAIRAEGLLRDTHAVAAVEA
jgi:hypothetical protein